MDRKEILQQLEYLEGCVDEAYDKAENYPSFEDLAADINSEIDRAESMLEDVRNEVCRLEEVSDNHSDLEDAYTHIREIRELLKKDELTTDTSQPVRTGGETVEVSSKFTATDALLLQKLGS